MRFRRKSKDQTARGGSFGGGAGSDSARPAKRQTGIELGQNSGSDGLPGRAGYPNGPRTELPTFFATRRPDGKPDQVVKRKQKGFQSRFG